MEIKEQIMCLLYKLTFVSTLQTYFWYRWETPRGSKEWSRSLVWSNGKEKEEIRKSLERDRLKTKEKIRLLGNQHKIERRE